MTEPSNAHSARRCIVVHPAAHEPGERGVRAAEAHLQEAVGLARAIDLVVDHAAVVNLASVRPATLFGAGLVQRYAEMLKERQASDSTRVDVAIVDRALTPVQQRNLEKAWATKVVDRTGLILEIFGERARTAEGELQVELAALEYQKSRLVRSWTHLERQRGGFGFVGGPGESQIETDRRLIRERIARIKRELEQVRRTRELHRRARRRVPYAVVALVGYTNAGKSTLFNALTRSEVEARDMLFATLDPTMRAARLPSGRTVILSDTVGFISDLPHELIEAFRATLEEVLAADIVVHVRDVSHPEAAQQKADVEDVLRSLGLVTMLEAGGLVEVLNKTDLLDEAERERLANVAARADHDCLALSARTGEGLAELLQALDDRLARAMQVVEVVLSPTDGSALAWLYRHGEVLQRTDADDAIRLQVRLSESAASRFARREQAVEDAPARAQAGSG